MGARKLWNWLNPAWGPKPKDLKRNVRNWHPNGDTHWVPKEQRDGPNSTIPVAVKAAVLIRDGHRCRYCGIPVISAEIRKLLRAVENAIYVKAIPWIDNDEANEHAAFQCMWLQYDHVVPWSHGGPSNETNVVISCALCNFGKDQYTLAQLEIADPRRRDPVPCAWDGLERLRAGPLPHGPKDRPKPVIFPKARQEGFADMYDIFFPDGYTSRGYLYFPNVNGMAGMSVRWMKERSAIAFCKWNGGLLVRMDTAQLRQRNFNLLLLERAGKALVNVAGMQPQRSVIPQPPGWPVTG